MPDPPVASRGEPPRVKPLAAKADNMTSLSTPRPPARTSLPAVQAHSVPMIETIRTFTALSEEFVELFMKHHPVAATEAGIHDYDHLMPDDSPDGLKARAAWLRDLDQRLVASVPWDEL